MPNAPLPLLSRSCAPRLFSLLCSEAGELPKFQFVEINGLRLPSPQHAYSALYEVGGGFQAQPNKHGPAVCRGHKCCEPGAQYDSFKPSMRSITCAGRHTRGPPCTTGRQSRCRRPLPERPHQAGPLLPQALTGDRAGPQKAAEALEEMFGGGGRRAGTSRRPTIVLVDEMDLLINKTQVCWWTLAVMCVVWVFV